MAEPQTHDLAGTDETREIGLQGGYQRLARQANGTLAPVVDVGDSLLTDRDILRAMLDELRLHSRYLRQIRNAVGYTAYGQTGDQLPDDD